MTPYPVRTGPKQVLSGSEIVPAKDRVIFKVLSGREIVAAEDRIIISGSVRA